jgi:hypothetical protein
MTMLRMSDQRLSQIQRLSWYHYALAALASCLTTLMLGLFWEIFWHFILSHPYNRFQPERDSWHFPILAWLFFSALNFLILFPFLRFPVRRRIAYVCLCVGWILVFWLFQAETR